MMMYLATGAKHNYNCLIETPGPTTQPWHTTRLLANQYTQVRLVFERRQMRRNLWALIFSANFYFSAGMT